jgi:hypothetical protein
VEKVDVRVHNSAFGACMCVWDCCGEDGGGGKWAYMLKAALQQQVNVFGE